MAVEIRVYIISSVFRSRRCDDQAQGNASFGRFGGIKELDPHDLSLARAQRPRMDYAHSAGGLIRYGKVQSLIFVHPLLVD